MNTIWFRVLVLLGCFGPLSILSQAQDDTSQSEPPVWDEMDVIAFVGRKISFDEQNKPEFVSITLPNGEIVEKLIPSWDSRYEARYEVLSVVHGDINSPWVDFEVYDHYGRPGLPNIPVPLVFLVRVDDRWVQSKYNNYSLSKTTDDDWAICGPPARFKNSADQGSRYVEQLGFFDPVKNENGEICTAGTRVSDIFQYQNETRFLPNKWKVTCNLELGLPKNVVAGTGSAPDAQDIGKAHANCVERLKLETGHF